MPDPGYGEQRAVNEAAADAAEMITVKIENAYSDGHSSTNEITVRPPRPDEDLELWFDNVVWPFTGDGHDQDGVLGSCYTATVIDGDPEMIGATQEWID